MNEINYKVNMLQSDSFKSYLLYLDYCKSEKARGEEEGVGQARAEKVSGDEEYTEQCFTIPFMHKNNQSHHILTLTYQHDTSYTMRCENPSSRHYVQQL